MKLNGKISIITGAANGIGKATALKFAAEGATVIVCDLNKEAVADVVEEVKVAGGKADGFVVNVTNQQQLNDMVAAVKEKYGRVDTLVNNAGIVMDARLQKMTEDQFDKVIDINLKGVYRCTKAVVDIMVEQGSGVILNASSVVGLYGNFGQTNYAAAKAGVIGMTQTWAKELGRKGVTANAVAPGFIHTEILDAMPAEVLDKMKAKVPVQRLGKPEEIAAVNAFLASDDAAYINGAVISVDGGITL